VVEVAFQARLQAPHLLKVRETTQAWRVEGRPEQCKHLAAGSSLEVDV
jgi:hypothetical protein